MAAVECQVCGQTLPPGTGWPEYCQHIETLHPYIPLGNPRRRLFPLGDEDGEDTQVVEKDPVDMTVEEDENCVFFFSLVLLLGADSPRGCPGMLVSPPIFFIGGIWLSLGTFSSGSAIGT